MRSLFNNVIHDLFKRRDTKTDDLKSKIKGQKIWECSCKNFKEFKNYDLAYFRTKRLV